MKYTITILAVIIFAFALSNFSQEFRNFAVLEVAKFWEKPWTIITATFLHSDLEHVANNLFFLLIYGILIEHLLGGKKFLTLFFVSGLFANLSTFIFYQNALVLGASGAISALIFSYLILKPKGVGFFFGVPMPMYLLAFFWILTNLILLGKTNIAVEAHLFGAFSGVVFGFLNKNVVAKEEKAEEEKVEVSEEEIDRWEEEHLT